MNFTPCLALILISSVIGVYNLNLEEKINNSNCYLSQRKVELFSNVQTLQKYSIKKLDKMSFKTVFSNCTEHDMFLSCPQKRYLPISFFPLHKIDFYLNLPSYLNPYLLILDIFRSHSKVIFRSPNNFFL